MRVDLLLKFRRISPSPGPIAVNPRYVVRLVTLHDESDQFIGTEVAMADGVTFVVEQSLDVVIEMLNKFNQGRCDCASCN